MMRERFGSWGQLLSEEDFALAVLLLGLIPPQLRTRSSVHQQEQGLLKYLQQDNEKPVEWWLDVLPNENTGWAAAHSPERLIDLIDSIDLPDLHIALRTDGVIDALQLWKVLDRCRVLVVPLYRKWSTYILMPVPASQPRFRWPVRVGFFPEPFTEPMASALDVMDYWNGNVFSTLALDRRHCECDVLIWKSFNLGTAIEELSAESARSGGIVTDLLFLCIDTDFYKIGRSSDLLPLYRTVEASGIVLVPSVFGNMAQVLQTALVEMSHNQSLDRAFALATDNQALLFTDESLLEESRLGERVHNIARALQQPEQMLRQVDLDDDNVGSLGLPKMRGMSRKEAGELIERAMPSFGFTGEVEQASAIGRLVRVMEDGNKNDVVARYLQAGISLPDEDSPLSNKPLKYNTDYDVRVFVGEKNAEYQSVDQPFPQTEPLNDGQLHRLTVIFWEPVVSPEPQIAHIELPAVGSSGLCVFHILTCLPMKELNARITVQHRGRVLQTAMLTAPVGKGRRKHKLKLDAAPRKILNGLEERQKFDTSIILNDVDGQSQIHVTNHNNAVVLKWDNADIKELISIVGDVIGDITMNPDAYSSLRAKGSEKLLRRLAQKGATLRDYLMRNVVDAQSAQTPTHVQLVLTDKGKILPIEYIYEFEAPEPESVICPKAEQGLNYAIDGLLEEGKCPDGCPPKGVNGEEISEDMLICPLAFWGVRCIIERRVDESKSNALLISEPTRPDDQILHPTARVMVAATDKANPPGEPDATQKMIDRIEKVAQNSLVVHSWPQWVDEVKNYSPALLTLLTHQTRDKENFDAAALDIGDPPYLIRDLVKVKHVPQKTHSIALIIGCETGVADISYENFATRFHEKGAVIVVSTIAKILGRHAAPLAAEIIEEMSRTKSPRPFGEIIRIVKCRLLLQGTPMVLSLTAIGDADWDIAGND